LKFSRRKGNRGRKTRWQHQILDRKQFVHCGIGYGAATTFHSNQHKSRA